MKDSKSAKGEEPKGNKNLNKSPKGKTKALKKNKNESSSNKNEEGTEVLLSLPGGLKYRMPGRKQRVVLGSIVIGLNLLLVLAVIVYFNSPDFQEFVYNFGRE